MIRDVLGGRRKCFEGEREDTSCKQNKSPEEQTGRGGTDNWCCPFMSSLRVDPGGPT